MVFIHAPISLRQPLRFNLPQTSLCLLHEPTVVSNRPIVQMQGPIVFFFFLFFLQHFWLRWRFEADWMGFGENLYKLTPLAEGCFIKQGLWWKEDIAVLTAYQHSAEAPERHDSHALWPHLKTTAFPAQDDMREDEQKLHLLWSLFVVLFCHFPSALS